MAGPDNLQGPTFTEVLVRDPLTAVTRKERLYLLAVSMIGIAMVQTGLVPSKIATFGIELDQPNRAALLFLLALVTTYFLIAFIVYAAADYLARREALKVAVEREDLSRYPPTILEPGLVGGLRLMFEFLLPVFVGVYAIYALLSQSFSVS